MKPRLKGKIVLIIMFLGISCYVYSLALPVETLEWDTLIQIKTDKEVYRQGDIVKVTVLFSNPYFRRVKYPYFTGYGLDANYEGTFNEAILGSINISPVSDWYTLPPFGREYFVRNREFVLNESGEFHIIFKMSGRESFTQEMIINVN